MTLPINTQITPTHEPVLHWGVHFVHEDVVTDYGTGDEAKAAAEKTVQDWSDTDYPAKLVWQTILPWTSSATTHSRVLLTQGIREAPSDPRGVLELRYWLVENGYDEEKQYKTGLREQVPLIKQMRKAPNIEVALNLLNLWMRENNYESLTSDESVEMLRTMLG